MIFRKRNILIFIILILVFVFWFYQQNIFSKESLKIEILAPNSVTVAEEFNYLVKFKNNSNITLENSKLYFEYPEGTLASGNVPALRVSKNIGDIYPAEEKIFNFPARFFGKKNETKIAKVSLIYQPEGLKAKYQSNSSISTVIDSVPLNFNFDFPSQVQKDYPFKFSLNYFSNSSFPLSDLRIKIDYPWGFKFKKANPKPFDKNQEWKIELLNMGEGGKINIEGGIEGDVSDVRIFKAQIGIWLENKFFVLKEITKGTEIIQSSVYITQQINGSSFYTANPGDLLHYEVFFRNISERVLENLFLVIKVKGNALDIESLRPVKGKIQPQGTSMVWDYRLIPELKSLAPNEEGKVEFWAQVKDVEKANRLFLNGIIYNEIMFNDDIKQTFSLKVNTKVSLNQRAYFYQTVFENTGPLPPEPGATTTYTISWQIQNYYNNLSKAVIKAKLPFWVDLTDKILPENVNFSFTSSTREIVWNIGDLTAGTGLTNPPAELNFQVVLEPQEFQQGQGVILVENPKFTFEDMWTGKLITKSFYSIDTILSYDPLVTEEQGRVKEIIIVEPFSTSSPTSTPTSTSIPLTQTPTSTP